ncbi:MAG TPA: LacI family DNA-binding transcriptional regulator [Chthoniobacteraceae bacterium]|jgi:DNA-binding LacI/PurR family transcriptional regulator|nr:LacI family DNA-binding transcriptional regulator [Chthoniobacteraceae bacterium]
MNPKDESALPHGETASGPLEGRPPKELGDLQKAITMAQIAKAAGVSQGAISSLLNDRDYGIRVSEKTRERVFKVCREMGYIPNDLRAVVRMYPELGEYCLLISDAFPAGLSDPFIARIARAAMAAVDDPSHPLILAFYDPARDYSGNLDSLPHPIRNGVASKFLFYGPINVSLVTHIQRRGLTVVSLGADAPIPGVISLIPDYAAASRLAIEHLFGLGHERIGIVSGPFGTSDAPTIALHRGVKAVYDERKVPIEAQNIVYGDLSYQAGATAFENLLSHANAPTAVFCLSDAAAAGVISAAHAHGLSVPRDLSVVGCYDDFCAQLIMPALTTANIPAEQMAEQGVKLLERVIRESLVPEPQRHILPVTLVTRQSTGPKKTA